MFTIFNKYEADNLIQNDIEAFRIIVYPNFINRFSLYLTLRIHKGIEIFGAGPKSMMAYWSLSDYAIVVALALEKGYRIFIMKDGKYFGEGNWYLEFRKSERESNAKGQIF